MKTLIIIPTYNERESLPELIRRLDGLSGGFDFLIIDDNSPDGTALLVEGWQKERADIFLLKRQAKLGLGTAYIEGFKWALANNYEAIVQMDADLSHNPEYLLAMLDSLSEHGLVVGSRYVSGGGVENWPFYRRLLSKGGSLYARIILGVNIKDLTGGYNIWHSEVLKKIDLDKILSEGYSFQIEMKQRAHEQQALIKEFPIVFKERQGGKSKMSKKIILEAMWRVWLIFFSSDRGKPYGKFLKFTVTGGIGFLIDLAIVVFLVEVVKLNLYLANCCSFVVAVTTVFLINKFWTFKDSSEAYAKQYFKYFMVSLGGLAWNFLLLNIFVDTLGIWYVYAKIIITVIVAFWNFFVNNYWTFKKV